MRAVHTSFLDDKSGNKYMYPLIIPNITAMNNDS